VHTLSAVWLIKQALACIRSYTLALNILSLLALDLACFGCGYLAKDVTSFLLLYLA